MKEDGAPLATGSLGSPVNALPSSGSFSEAGDRRLSFWYRLKEVGAEHDRQLSGLLVLIRELRLELNRATEGRDDEITRLRSENMELKRQISLGPLKLANGVYSKHSAMPVRAAASQIGAPLSKETDAEIEPSQASTTLPQQSPVMSNLTAGNESSVGLSRNADKATGAAAAMPRLPEILARSPSMSQSLASFSGLPLIERAQLIMALPQFEAFIGFLILANTIVMMFEYQYIGLQAGFVTQFPDVLQPASELWPSAALAFKTLDVLFSAIFTIELAFRFAIFRCNLLRRPLNWIDMIAVFSSLLAYILKDSSIDASVVRLSRVARVMRGLTIVKFAKVITGMAFSQAAHSYIIDLGNPEEKRHELYRYFGSFTRAFISMFEIHMANWAKPCRIFMEAVGEYYGAVMILYRCSVGFSLMNVIGAVFVQQTMAVAQNDNEIMILRKQKEMDSYNKKLKHLFFALDENQDGMLCREEFNRMESDPALKVWMNALDMSPDDLEGLFDLLDTGDGFVSMDEFLVGATRVKGLARSLDMAQLLVTIARLEKTMEQQRPLPKAMGVGGTCANLQPREQPTFETHPGGMSAWANKMNI